MNWYEFPRTDAETNELIERVNGGDLGATAKPSLMYLNGYGVEQDINKGAKLLEVASKDIYSINMCYKTASLQNDPGGHYGLYFMFKFGLGVAQSDEIARKHLERAAQAGFLTAEYLFGDELVRLSITSKADIRDGERWLLKAAKRGFSIAYTSLYSLYRMNTSLKDEERAVDWLKRACATGDSYNLDLLGWVYAKGEGVEVDPLEAAKWFYLAACQGDRMQKHSQNALDKLVLAMDDRSVSLVVEMANQWITENAASASAFKGFKVDPLHQVS